MPIEHGLLLRYDKETRFDTAIHMIGVIFDLAIVWIDSKQEDVDVQLARRWRPFYIPDRPAKYVLEIAVQRIADFRVGERVMIESLSIDNEK